MTGVILIIADDAGYGDLGCYGHANLLTPNLDALAAAGRKFTQFYVASPVCSPSRTAYMTGQLPQWYHVHNADSLANTRRYFLPSGTMTIGRLAKMAGAATGFFGKWHLGETGGGRDTQMPRKFGFDRFFGSTHGRSSLGWNEFNTYDDAYWLDDEPPLVQHEGYATDVCFDKLIEWIQARIAAGQDYLALVPTHAPHDILSPNVAERALYTGQGFTEAQEVYWGTMSNLDTNVGRLITALTNAGELANTTILYTSDNGPESVATYAAGSAGPLRGKKTNLWDGGIKVPLIVRGPGITAGSTDSSPRWSLDVLPTLAELFGVTLPSGAYPGTSLFSAVGERDFFWEYHGNQRPTDQSGKWAMRRGDLKLVRFAENGSTDELYDLATDAAESIDVAAEEDFAVEFASMQSALTAWWTSCPRETSNNSAAAIPETFEEALAIQNGLYEFAQEVVPRVFMAGVSDDLTDLDEAAGILDTALGYPRASVCGAGETPVTVTTHGSVRGTHSTYGGASVVSSGVVESLCTPAALSSLDSAQQETLHRLLAKTSGAPQS